MADEPSRRTFLGAITAGGIAALAGCNSMLGAQDTTDNSESPTDAPKNAAHTVSVYLAEREATRDVTVVVEESDGTVVFEREYALSDGNESHEDATFPESTGPETVVVTVDGERFEEPWPDGSEAGEPCTDGNWEGVEVYVQGQPDEAPSIRLDGNCQHVTLD